MKKTALFVCLAAVLIACQSTDKKSTPAGELTKAQKDSSIVDSANFTTIQWLDTTSLDLGKVKEGDVVDVSYRFKNSGDKNLVIQDVVPGCGCTVPEKPEKPFLPGEQGVIRAKFNSAGRLGMNEKYITVKSNTTPDQQWILNFKVEVEKK